MAKRIGGPRRKSRHKLTKHIKRKGKLSISQYIQELEQGTKVCLKAEPAVQKGMYHMRFHGKIGIIKGKSGRSYKVEIKDKNKKKMLIVHPVHLKRV